MPIVTISRQFGAGGSSVAALIAQRLECEVVDKRLIAEVAERLRLEPSDVEAEDERGRSVLDRLVRAFAPLAPLAVSDGAAWEPPYPDAAYDPRQAILELTQEAIREVARTGNAVIVGRGGAQVLCNRPGVLHVSLVAREDVRICTVMERSTVSESVARRWIHRVDANRAAYHHQVYGVDWQDANQYTMVLNTGLLGYEKTADLIVAAL